MPASAERRPLRRGGPPSFAHLRRLTDDTGLLEHALGRIPRRSEGYTTDDNARALWLATEWLSLGGEALRDDDRGLLKELAENYMAFLLWTQSDEGWWHNNIAYNRTRESEVLSANQDCQGRSVWAAADAWVRLESPLRDTARILFMRTLPILGEIDSLRGQAFVMAACAHVLEAGGRGDIELPESWRHQLTDNMQRTERMMNETCRAMFGNGWRWFEPAMTYGNGTLPWAMLRTSRVTGNPETLRNGLESLSFLLERMTAEEGWLRPIGNDGWGTPDAVSRWDQQPLEMFKLALALEEAARAVESAEAGAEGQETDRLVGSTRASAAGRSGDRGSGGSLREREAWPASVRKSEYYRAQRDLCLEWFYGYNDKGVPMCDPVDGSCCDGLMETGPNINCGAESTLSYLMTEALCRRG
ncbi:hypothetical protein [Cohnella caldifontis]|uniref:hypothetical protein n=1 Tax=Cohnella caldifontis TaxID=3027471 RepID=UPI0023EADF1E|nr:hypothetical protein [Cohnella sp. YIM B05605]